MGEVRGTEVVISSTDLDLYITTVYTESSCYQLNLSYLLLPY